MSWKISQGHSWLETVHSLSGVNCQKRSTRSKSEIRIIPETTWGSGRKGQFTGWNIYWKPRTSETIQQRNFYWKETHVASWLLLLFYCQKSDGQTLFTVRTENAGEKLQRALEISQDQVLTTRLNNEISPSDALAIDMWYHKLCWARHVVHVLRDDACNQGKFTNTALPMQIPCLIELINLVDFQTQNKAYLPMDIISRALICYRAGRDFVVDKALLYSWRALLKAPRHCYVWAPLRKSAQSHQKDLQEACTNAASGASDGLESIRIANSSFSSPDQRRCHSTAQKVERSEVIYCYVQVDDELPSPCWNHLVICWSIQKCWSCSPSGSWRATQQNVFKIQTRLAKVHRWHAWNEDKASGYMARDWRWKHIFYQEWDPICLHRCRPCLWASQQDAEGPFCIPSNFSKGASGTIATPATN